MYVRILYIILLPDKQQASKWHGLKIATRAYSNSLAEFIGVRKRTVTVQFKTYPFDEVHVVRRMDRIHPGPSAMLKRSLRARPAAKRRPLSLTGSQATTSRRKGP